MRILVIDIGGTNAKVLATGHKNRVEFTSGPKLKPARMVSEVRAATVGWKYDVVSIGYPGVVINGRPHNKSSHLGTGWVGYNYIKAFGRPVKIINDAAMQALGSYQGGRMLFLGLGTGLGSAVVSNNVLESLELGILPFKKGGTFEDYVGVAGLKRQGKKKWRYQVMAVAERLKRAVQADYVVLGGGNSRLLKKLPPGMRLGNNSNAFRGGYRLWNKNYNGSNDKRHVQ